MSDEFSSVKNFDKLAGFFQMFNRWQFTIITKFVFRSAQASVQNEWRYNLEVVFSDALSVNAQSYGILFEGVRSVRVERFGDIPTQIIQLAIKKENDAGSGCQYYANDVEDQRLSFRFANAAVLYAKNRACQVVFDDDVGK